MKYLIILVLLFSNLSFAQNNVPTLFETELKTTAPKSNEPQIAGEYIFNLLGNLREHRNQLAKGNVSKFEMGTIAKEFYKLYASGYLLCNITNGICKEFLDTILEIDLINSKITGNVSCSNTLLFWKAWLENDMEKRHSHQTKITHVQEVSAFNKKERPKYLQCRKTIENLIADSTVSPQEFFKQRYSGAVGNVDYIQKTIDFFVAVKQKNIDIYASVGL